MTSIPAGTTHQHEAFGLFYKKTPKGVYMWSPRLNLWRYMEDGDARRAIAKATPVPQ